jgi:predicted transcriptional regulator
VHLDGCTWKDNVIRIAAMTKMLDEAIKKVRGLPEADQDEAAEILLSVVSKKGEPVRLDDETRAAIREGRDQALRGEFVSDEEMAAFFKRHGVKRERA